MRRTLAIWLVAMVCRAWLAARLGCPVGVLLERRWASCWSMSGTSGTPRLWWPVAGAVWPIGVGAGRPSTVWVSDRIAAGHTRARVSIAVVLTDGCLAFSNGSTRTLDYHRRHGCLSDLEAASPGLSEGHRRFGVVAATVCRERLGVVGQPECRRWSLESTARAVRGSVAVFVGGSS